VQESEKKERRDTKKEILNIPKRNAHYTSLKTVGTVDSRWESKNLMPNYNSGNFQSSNSFRGDKGFVNQRSRSDTSLWTKPKSIGQETGKLLVQKATKKY